MPTALSSDVFTPRQLAFIADITGVTLAGWYRLHVTDDLGAGQ
jgi:hypothetical protein